MQLFAGLCHAVRGHVKDIRRRDVSSGLRCQGREGLALVVALARLQAVVEDPDEPVPDVAQCGGVAVAVIASPVVVGSCAG